MNLSFPPEIQKLIDDRVRSGRYDSPEAVIASAMSTLEQQERLAELGTDDVQTLFPGLKEQLAAGLAAARAGDVIDGEAFFDELDREDEELSKGRKSA
jgi:Arc/MetJ-type ribon-helix-helix transcriptional regulator